jgi:hypothetical protein
VSKLEDRLRDAYLGAADTVAPDSTRGLDEPVRRHAGAGLGRRWGRWGRSVLIPVGAAAAVTVIVVLAAMLVRAPGGPGILGGPAAAGGAPKFLIANQGGFPLQVRDAATGALVAQVPRPADNPAPRGVHTYINSVATGDGVSFLVSFYRNPCRSWVYQFRLNAQGQPSALTPFSAIPSTKSDLYGLTVSRNGQLVGYSTGACLGQSPPAPHVLAVANLGTGKTTRWTMTASNSVVSVSMTPDGRLLCYLGASGAGVIPTSAAAGPVAERGHTVVQAHRFGPSDAITFAVFSPDEKSLYFSTYTQLATGPGPGQIRVEDVATGRTRVVQSPIGSSIGLIGLVTADPSARYLLLELPSGNRSVKLGQLDLLTGKFRYLPSGWMGQFASVNW